MRRFRASFLIGLFCLAITGCGSDNVPLEGKVTFADDGSPLTCGTVLFDNGTILARGPIESDGTYTVGLEREGDGILPGTYQVSIVDAAKEIPSGSDYVPPSYEKLIHEKYFSKETSGLEVSVDSSMQQFDIEVDRPE